MTGTERYANRFPHMSFRRWSGGEMVSTAGFGSYRINARSPEHARALQKALLHGVNCIDTSANYGDGVAEQVVGAVVENVAHKHGIARDELFIVTKAGYIQGMNYHRAHSAEQNGHGFEQVVKYGEGLWHCIHPQFLEDQLSRSLRSLKTTYIDAFLLHNPEYFLLHAEREGVDIEAARQQFYERIAAAFEYLEQQAAAGRIRNYGISSNSFAHASDAPDFVSLEKCLEISSSLAPAGSYLRVIQLPFNLIECGAATELNAVNNTKTVLELAEEHHLNVMTNRVLNAITQNSLIRLAEHAFAGQSAPSHSDIEAAIGDLIAHELKLPALIDTQQHFEEHTRETILAFLSPASHLSDHWQSFDSIEHWHEVEVQYLKPRISEAIEAISEHPTPECDAWIERFRSKSQELFRLLTHHYAVISQPRLDRIHAKALAMLGPDCSQYSISQAAFTAVRATSGVSCTLMGARRERYVDELVSSVQLSAPKLQRKDWRRLPAMVETA